MGMSVTLARTDTLASTAEAIGPGPGLLRLGEAGAAPHRGPQLPSETDTETGSPEADAETDTPGLPRPDVTGTDHRRRTDRRRDGLDRQLPGARGTDPHRKTGGGETTTPEGAETVDEARNDM